jgi:hypothetical protein
MLALKEGATTQAVRLGGRSRVIRLSLSVNASRNFAILTRVHRNGTNQALPTTMSTNIDILLTAAQAGQVVSLRAPVLKQMVCCLLAV